MSETKTKEVVKTRFDRAVELVGKHALGELEVMVRLMNQIRFLEVCRLFAIPTILWLFVSLWPGHEWLNRMPTWATVVAVIWSMLVGFVAVCTVIGLFISSVVAFDEYSTVSLALQLKKKDEAKKS